MKEQSNFFLGTLSLFILLFCFNKVQADDLMNAVMQGNYDGAKTLLEEGRAKNNPLDPLLFKCAVDNQDYRLVALLMSYGLCDTRLLEGAKRPFLHNIRELYQRLPEPGFCDQRLSELGAGYVEELKKNGIVCISGLVSACDLADMQKDFKKFVDSMDDQRARGINVENKRDQYYCPENNVYHSNNPFALSTTLVDVCCSPVVCSIVNMYLGKVGYITKGWATHYMPGGKEINFFTWHHDKSGSRLKMMILLGDVEERSRHLSYVLGSHKMSHAYETYCSGQSGIDYYEKITGKTPIIFKALGKAGDIFLFDTNGIHKANCGEIARDTFIITYSPDKHLIFKVTLPYQFFDNKVVDERHPFFRVLAAQSRKYFMPAYGGWLGSLDHVDAWY